MFPRVEGAALVKTMQDTIQENVPSALEKRITEGAFAYKSSDQDGLAAFCLLLIEQDHLELRFPQCPDLAASDQNFESVPGTDACRLIIQKRTDLPGEILNAAIKAAAGIG